MAGSSIAAPDAAGWVTDLLNAAYYARPPAARDVDDLRLAHAIVVTAWWRLGGPRLHLHDLLRFHRAFVAARLRRTPGSPRGTLTREALLEGGERLLGIGFAAAYADPRRRGWGVVFRDETERAAYEPERRQRHAALGMLTPPVAPAERQSWHTYAPAPVASAERVAELLATPERWPDAASSLGRFTPVRGGGLPGQTFEIEVVAAPVARAPVFQRGYVTATRIVNEPGALAEHVAGLDAGLARAAEGDRRALPEGGEPVLALDLTTHAGHFLGAAVSHLLLYRHDGAAWLRDVGQWDPLPWHLAQAYQRAGRAGQAAFWGEGDPSESMLHQMGLVA